MSRGEQSLRICDNRDLMKVTGDDKGEGKLHDEDLDSFKSPNSITLVKSRNMRWVIKCTRKVSVYL
jgi:hypothetical protein